MFILGVGYARSLAARLNGLIDAGSFLIPSDNATIIFSSDAVVQKRGFLLSYKFIENRFPSCKF